MAETPKANVPLAPVRTSVRVRPFDPTTLSLLHICLQTSGELMVAVRVTLQSPVQPLPSTLPVGTAIQSPPRSPTSPSPQLPRATSSPPSHGVQNPHRSLRTTSACPVSASDERANPRVPPENILNPPTAALIRFFPLHHPHQLQDGPAREQYPTPTPWAHPARCTQWRIYSPAVTLGRTLGEITHE